MSSSPSKFKSPMKQIKNEEKILEQVQKRCLNIIKKFRLTTGKTFSNLIESILLNLREPKRGVLFFDVIESINAFGEDCLLLEEKFTLFRALDINQNGNAYYDDLQIFFLQYRTKNSSLKLFFF